MTSRVADFVANATPISLLKGDLAIVAGNLKRAMDKLETATCRQSWLDPVLAIIRDRANNPIPEYEALEIEIKRLKKIESAASKVLLEVGKVDGMTAGLLLYVGSPSEDWLKMWKLTEGLRAALGGQVLLGAQDSNLDAEPHKIVVVIEGGVVRNVLAAEGGFSVAVIDYDKNADLDDMVVIPQGDGKNAYALAAIHEPEVTNSARLDELYSAVVKADPASDDDDCVRPRP